MDFTEKKLSEQYYFEGRIMKARVDEVELPGGGRATREVCEHLGGVGILPIDADGQVLLVRQFRYPFGELLLEIPAGKLDHGPGEDHYACGVRELREETGLLASPEELLPIAQDRREQSQSVRDIYLYRCPQERPAVALQAGETEDFRWAARAQVEALIGAGAVCEPIARLYEALRDNAALACLR